MRLSRFSLASLAGLVLLVAGHAAAQQSIPNFLDPSVREVIPDVSAVPAIRFLTTPDFPPFNFRDDEGELVGFNIDLARALCTDLGITCTIQAWPWEQAPQALADNQGDALIAGLAITPENGRSFDFSTIYMMFPGRFVTRLADARSFDPDDAEGRSIAVRRGSAHAEFVRRYLPEATLAEFETEFEALNALNASAVDAYFGDGMRAAFWLNDHLECCDFAGPPYLKPELFGEGLAVALPQGRDAVRQVIDYGLARLKRSGVYDELYLRWFPVSFY